MDYTDESDPNFAIVLNFDPIFSHKSSVIKEILFHGHKKAQLVFSHPLMESYLTLQNERLSKFFTASFLMYFFFLISFTGEEQRFGQKTPN